MYSVLCTQFGYFETPGIAQTLELQDDRTPQVLLSYTQVRYGQ